MRTLFPPKKLFPPSFSSFGDKKLLLGLSIEKAPLGVKCSECRQGRGGAEEGKNLSFQVTEPDRESPGLAGKAFAGRQKAA